MGLPSTVNCVVYIGSKRKIAPLLVNKIINDRVLNDIDSNAILTSHQLKDFAFIDLFGGGGAMTFEAARRGLNVVYNDIYKPSYDIVSYLIQNKKFPIFTDFVKRDIFYKTYDYCNTYPETPKEFSFILYSSSFSSKFMEKSYTYGKDIEKIKENIHNLYFKGTQESADFLTNYFKVPSFIFDKFVETAKINHLNEKISKNTKTLKFKDIEVKYLDSKNNKNQNLIYDFSFLKNIINYCEIAGMYNCQEVFNIFKDEIFNITPSYFFKYLKSNYPLKTKNERNDIRGFESRDLGRNAQLEKYSNLFGIFDYNLDNIKCFNLDYEETYFKALQYFKDLGFKEQNIITYCDIPYKGTFNYHKGGFNNEDFYKFVKDKGFYISEYDFPGEKLFEIKHTKKMNGTVEKQETFERLFKS